MAFGYNKKILVTCGILYGIPVPLTSVAYTWRVWIFFLTNHIMDLKLSGDPDCHSCNISGQCQDPSSNCVLCPAGHHQNLTGQTVCYECERGKYQDKAGKATCIPCPLGYFQNKRGQTSCLKCEKGHYQNATGETTCKLCQTGSFSRWAIYCTWVSMITDWDTFYTT